MKITEEKLRNLIKEEAFSDLQTAGEAYSLQHDLIRGLTKLAKENGSYEQIEEADLIWKADVAIGRLILAVFDVEY